MGTRAAVATAAGLKWSAIGLGLVQAGLLFYADYLGLELGEETKDAIGWLGTLSGSMLGGAALAKLRKGRSP